MQCFGLHSAAFAVLWLTKLGTLACPESPTCACEYLSRAVTCSRTPSLKSRLPKGIPAYTESLKITLSTLMKIGPTAFGSTRVLAEIDLNSNKIETISETSFLNLPRLRTLNIDNNRLKLVPERAFLRSPKLKKLSLNGNKILVLVTHNFAGLRGLEELNLLRNPTMCIALDAFAGLSNLRRLEMSEMNATLDSSLLSNLGELRRLVIRSFHGVKSIPSDLFKSNQKLEQLYLEEISLVEGLSSDLLKPLKRLNTLSLSGCGLACIPTELLKPVQSSLIELDMSHNLLKKISPDDFKDMVRLATLNLRKTGLSSIPPDSLALSSLVALDLYGNKLRTLQRSVFGKGDIALRNVTLGNNPWICDCQLLWLVEERLRHSRDIPVVCTEPSRMQGYDIRYVKLPVRRGEYFQCQAPNISKFGLLTDGKRTLTADRTKLVSFDARCEATGYPVPQIKWILDSRSGVRSRRNVDDSGHENRVSHIVGSLLKPKRERRGVTDDQLCTVCDVSSKHTTDNIWVSDDGTLRVRDLLPDSALGIYTCIANNSYGFHKDSITVSDDATIVSPSPQSMVGQYNQDFSNEYVLPASDGKQRKTEDTYYYYDDQPSWEDDSTYPNWKAAQRNNEMYDAGSHNQPNNDWGYYQPLPLSASPAASEYGNTKDNPKETVEKICKAVQCSDAYRDVDETEGFQRDSEANAPYLELSNGIQASLPRSQTSVCCGSGSVRLKVSPIGFFIAVVLILYSYVTK